uniref:DUF4371 domain-containing protein n=1 Tax=Octopus bimaculoides TaxID=37653 RepID=A0A0L8HXH0_OCTBM
MSVKKRKYLGEYIRFAFVSLQKSPNQILDQVRDSPVFAIQCDGTTDIAQCSQLLVCAHFVSGNCVKEEMFCHPMDSCTTAAAIFRDVSNFFQENQLSRIFKLLCKDMESEYEALLFHTNLPLAYLVDIFEALNALDLNLQGKSINILTHHDTIRTFMGNTASFSYLDSALIHGNLNSELQRQIITHLTDLQAEFISYFPDIDEKREAWKFIRKPFQCEVTNVLDEVQEKFLELKFNSTAKEDFIELDLEMFWILKCSGSCAFLFIL